MKLSGLANGIVSALTGGGDDAAVTERREEERSPYLGQKIIIKQRKALGIMHLRNISRTGASGITDMPLEIGSLVFLELKRPHFYAAEVIWANNLRIGLALAKPLKPEMLHRLDPDSASRDSAQC